MTKADEDASMHKKAPLIYAGSLLMVAMQLFAVYGVLTAMLHPSCVSNAQCNERPGFFCYRSENDERGNCMMCGSATPLPAYLSTESLPDPKFNDNDFTEYNLVMDLHYSAGFAGKRSETPDKFAGFNFTMVRDRCAPPIQGFRGPSYDGDKRTTVVTDRGDLDRDYPWIPNERIKPPISNTFLITTFSAASTARWCAACVEEIDPLMGEIHEVDGLTVSDDETGLAVSIMNNRLLAMLSTKAMAPLDWVALLLCSYMVGLTVAGEIKE
jgi:hypothetical protein